MVRVDMKFLFACLTWYLMSEHIVITYLWRRFSEDFRTLFEDFLRFAKICPKSDKRSEHFQNFPKIANISEGNRRFLRKKQDVLNRSVPDYHRSYQLWVVVAVHIQLYLSLVTRLAIHKRDFFLLRIHAWRRHRCLSMELYWCESRE